MTPTTNQNDRHWRTIKFFQEAGLVFNMIPKFNVRDWALRYTIWLRDNDVVRLPVPELKNPIEDDRRQARIIRKKLDAIAVRYGLL